MKIHHTTLIGCGGIGSQLAEPMIRLLSHHPNALPNALFVDGDEFEARNAERQHFDARLVGANKAKVARDSVVERITRANVKEYPQYLSSAVAFAGLLSKWGAWPHFKDLKTEAERTLAHSSWALVVLAVDNDQTRRFVYDGLLMVDPSIVPNVVVLDAANEYETASVAVYARSKGEDIILSPVTRYANLREPKDRAPGGGCMAEAPSTPQLLVANMAAAFGVMVQLQALLDGKQFTDDLSIKVRSMEMGRAGGWLNGG